ncbi:helix-turn-helix domain-containing protein [Streptomyces sp. ID38640]|uniref:helix-turn-helix domain-containing protein n=1 Tax=Streptomyces sp. ID38640 TaxID=1265399 RepID=UPI00140EBF87|nr:helix-turn-helix domain-containing protein [Streptomyces sp. ID38640]QIK07578.1 helix-turn-helix domain-containing protein [Streptomyces sp. ID38640]
MAEQQFNAPARAQYGIRRTPSGVHKVTEHQDPGYTIVGNHLTQHRSLSGLAIGLAAHIQSLPEGAPVDIRTLARRFPEGRDRIAAALRELEAYGYLERVRRRTDDGRVVTLTISYNNPQATRARRAREAAEQAKRRTAVEPVPAAPADGARAPAPTPQPPPVRTTSPRVRSEPSPPPREPRAHAHHSRAHHTPAAALLANLRRDDPRLLLSVRDIQRLTPSVAAWLERGASPEAVRGALTTGLPATLRHPAALLAHRLTDLLPPPLPAASQVASSRDRPSPLQTCDGCDRAFRAPAPGRCRDCRHPAAERGAA